MKTLAAAIVGLAATAAAQNYTTVGPFALTVKGTANSNISGFLGACHAGAGIEQLCYVAGTPDANSRQFYLNTTTYSTGSPYTQGEGPLIYELLINTGSGTENVSSPMSFLYNTGSNVAVPFFEPSESTDILVNFDRNNELFIPNDINETLFTYSSYPTSAITAYAQYNWYVCMTYVEGYYYRALAWVTAGTPNNPTCQAVTVTRSS